MKSRIGEISVVIVLIAATLAVYWPVHRFGYVYDDQLYVVGNENVQKGMSKDSLKYAFTSFDASNWHPLTWLSHMLDSSVFGDQSPGRGRVNPAGPHVVNLGFHVINMVLLFLLMRAMTGLMWPSAFVAGAFALHPLHIESVAWIAERKDVLSTLFGLLAMLAYVRYARQPSMARNALVVLFMAMSLMCKPMFVTLPFVLLLLDYWPLKRIGITSQPEDGLGGWKNPVDEGPGWSWRIAWKLLLEKLPLFALSAVSCAITVRAQIVGGSLEKTQVLPVADRIGNAIVSYVRYLGKTIWPTDLAMLYPHPGHWPGWTVGACAGLLIAVTIAALATARKHPYFIVGWLLFLGMLVPVIGIVQVGVQAMADRYTYVPLVGLFIAIAWGIASALGKQRAVMSAAYGVMALAGLWFATYLALPPWADNERLYRHTLAVTEGNWAIEMNLGEELSRQATGPKDPRLFEAGQHFSRASHLREDVALAKFKVAETLIRLGQIDNGLAGFREVLRMSPNNKEVMNNLAWWLATHPDPRRRNGAEAVQLAERACELGEYKLPGDLDTLAAAYAEAGRFDDAVKMAQRARDLAASTNQMESVQGVDERIELYRSGRPYHMGEPASQPQ